MIPYDDLVAALSAWRARQGLPVSATAGAPQSAAPQAAASVPGSGPRTAPPSAPPRTSPPVAPPGRGRPVSVPPPLAQPDEEVDAAMLDEAQYDNEGDDFAMGFAGSDGDGATAIGSPPTRDTQPSRGRKDEW